MAAAIQRMAANNEEREQYAANAKDAFLSQFTLQAMVDSYMDLYRSTPRARRATMRHS
jgi:glycosyltransferase involved in cell wall biosynthesis